MTARRVLIVDDEPYTQRVLDITRTKVKSPQTNGICERFHKPMLNKLYRIALRKKIYNHY